MNKKRYIDSLISKGVKCRDASEIEIKAMELTKGIKLDVSKLQAIYDFIHSNNQYAVYLKENIDEFSDDSVKLNMREGIKDIADSYNWGSDWVWSKLEKLIACEIFNVGGMRIVFAQILVTVHLATRILNTHNLREIAFEDQFSLKEQLGFVAMKRVESLVIPKDTDINKRCYKLLLSLSRKDNKKVIRKLNLLGNTDDIEYDAAVMLDTVIPVVYIHMKINGRVILEQEQEIKLLNKLKEVEYTSKEFDDYIELMIQEYNTRGLRKLRRDYRFLTPEIMSDEEIMSKSRLELAGINYKLKLQVEGGE